MRDNKSKGKTTGRNPNYKKPSYAKSPKPERRKDDERGQANEDSENMVFGRNSVMEAIRSGRTVDKIFVAKGDREGSIVRVIAMAKENGITVVEAEKAKLNEYMSQAEKLIEIINAPAEYFAVRIFYFIWDALHWLSSHVVFIFNWIPAMF